MGVALRFTAGDADEAISVMREAAAWLIDTGRPMWRMDEITRERINNAPEAFIVAWAGGESAAALTLSFDDPVFWPDVPKDTSGFIHKLCVRRKYAGRGVAGALISHCADICRGRGARAIRLDCDANRPALRAFYERAGFALLDTRTINTALLGEIDVAYYIMDL